MKKEKKEEYNKKIREEQEKKLEKKYKIIKFKVYEIY